jgi:hypothetical protein
MIKATPGSAETLLRKSSWAGFVIGAALMVLATIYQKEENEYVARVIAHYNDKSLYTEHHQGTRDIWSRGVRENAQDYWKTRTGGLALILLGLGCSLYANKLRKARTGA